MNCIIIEDQPPAQRILKKYIADIGTLQLEATFSDAIQAMEFLRTETVDLIFLDIHLPKISGIDFLRSMTHPPQVILTTAFPDYALESYEFNVVDYLLKPFSFQRFVKAVAKVPVRRPDLPQMEGSPADQTAQPSEVFIKSGYDYIRITIREIVYIQADADYTELHLKDKKVLSSEPLRYWLEILPTDQFVQVHKSYIVNAGSIEKISGNQIFLENEAAVPIGRTYKDSFIQRFVR
jgi:DNA-binding LytR/AlgR family response regulator